MKETTPDPAHIVINEALDELDTMRQMFLELIEGTMPCEDQDPIDFTKYKKFHDACDPAYATMFDEDNDCHCKLEIFGVGFGYVIDENGAEHTIEDLEAKELLMLYRCMIEYLEWKDNGKILYNR